MATLSPLSKEKFEGEKFRGWYNGNYQALRGVDLESPGANRDLAKLVTGNETHYDGLAHEQLASQRIGLESVLKNSIFQYATHDGNLPTMVSHKAVADEDLINLLFNLKYATDTGDENANAIAKKIAELAEVQRNPEAQAKYIEAQMSQVHPDFRQLVYSFGADAIYKNSLKSDQRNIVSIFSEKVGDKLKLQRSKLVNYWTTNINYLGSKASALEKEAEGIKATDVETSKKKLKEAAEARNARYTIALQVVDLVYQSLEQEKQEAEAKKKAEEAQSAKEAGKGKKKKKQ